MCILVYLLPILKTRLPWISHSLIATCGAGSRVYFQFFRFFELLVRLKSRVTSSSFIRPGMWISHSLACNYCGTTTLTTSVKENNAMRLWSRRKREPSVKEKWKIWYGNRTKREKKKIFSGCSLTIL